MARQLMDLVKALSPDLRRTFKVVDQALTSRGSLAVHDVKTIYISYMIGTDMVAALYPRTREIEIALALPEDHSSTVLRDATHLTWRTLPVSVVLANEAEAVTVLDLILEAVDRVAAGVHDVNRDNDHFIKSRRDRDAL